MEKTKGWNVENGYLWIKKKVLSWMNIFEAYD